jgi:DNA processing protein
MRPIDDLAPWVELSLVRGLSSKAQRALLTAFGLPSNVFGATPAQLAPVVGEPLAAAIRSGEQRALVEPTLRWLEQPGNGAITLADADYPKQLLQIPDPPILIYVRGDRRRLAAPSLAVVGSRNATPQGLANAESFARALSDAGLGIASGLALGIDAAAHRGGLAGRSSSIAVLGCGADIVYPSANAPLFAQIAAKGVIATEFALGTAPLAGNFPRRNRLISGLARGCLVVEAALASGSLITARLAAEQGREVFAIPGSIHSPLSRGCHALLKQGAKLVESAQDVLEELGIIESVAIDHHTLGQSDELLQYMGYDPCRMDALMRRAGLTADAVSAKLLQLELEGKVSRLPGGLYQRLA